MIALRALFVTLGIALMVCAIIIMSRMLFQILRSDKRLCTQCGYSLQFLSGNVCPECGSRPREGRRLGIFYPHRTRIFRGFAYAGVGTILVLLGTQQSVVNLIPNAILVRIAPIPALDGNREEAGLSAEVARRLVAEAFLEDEQSTLLTRWWKDESNKRKLLDIRYRWPTASAVVLHCGYSPLMMGPEDRVLVLAIGEHGKVIHTITQHIPPWHAPPGPPNLDADVPGIELGTLSDGAHDLTVDLVLMNDLVRNNQIWRDSFHVPVLVGGSVRDTIASIRSAQSDVSMRAALDVSLSPDCESAFVTYRKVPNVELNDATIALRLIFLSGGKTVSETRVCLHDNCQVGSEVTRWLDLSENSEALRDGAIRKDIRVLVLGDGSLALRDRNGTRFWDGEFLADLSWGGQ